MHIIDQAPGFYPPMVFASAFIRGRPLFVRYVNNNQLLFEEIQ